MSIIDTKLDVSSEQITLQDIPKDSTTSKINTIKNILISSSAVLNTAQNRPKLLKVCALTSALIFNRYATSLLLGKIVSSFDSTSAFYQIGNFCFSKTTLVTSFVALSTLSPFLHTLQCRLTEQIQWNIMEELLEKSVNHFLERPLDFHQQTSVTEMFQLIQKTFPLQRLGISLLTEILPTAVESIFSSCILAYQFGPVIGISLIVLEILFASYSIMQTKAVLKIKDSTNQAWDDTFQKIGEVLVYYKLMKDCNCTESAKNKIKKSLESLKSIDLHSHEILSNTEFGYQILSSLHMFFVSSYICLNPSKFDPQKIVSLLNYLVSFNSLLPRFGFGITQLCANYPSLEYVFSKIQMPSGILDPYPNNTLIIDKAPAVEFQNIRFEYPAKNEPLFANLTFTIPAGQKVAIVSESGAGKTSIFQLLYRYFDPQEGIIKINDQDIHKVGLNSLQSQITIIGQQAILFNDTIRNNILYGSDENVSDEKILELAEKLGYKNLFTELPDGLDTNVGEGGKTVSGGQAQKIAILRCLLKKSKIRLLDEVTASLDALSSDKILQYLLNPDDDITTIFITHKLSEAQKAQKILFLENGQIIATGSHEELLSSCQSYQRLYQAQKIQSTNL